MADAVQPQQRNLYQTKFAHLEYRDGLGNSYNEQLRLQSWPIVDDVPPQAQPSASAQVMAGEYNPLHPNIQRTGSDLSFMQTHGGKLDRVEADPAAPVHSRLFVPSRTLARPPSRPASSRPELDGDDAFAAGRLDEAIEKYTLALTQKPTLVCYEKRCAAWAHVGRYKQALADAEYIMARQPGNARAELRVKNIKNFLDCKANSTPGYKNSHVTLLCALTPRDLRQWRASGPSLYNM